MICGGGVIGACLAYFLARRGLKPIVVERAGVACAASGKSGGFLARDWCDGTPLERLARRSFALHASLAEELHDDWGYRRMTTYAGYGPAAGGQARHRLPWVSDAIALSDRLGTTETTAQVHPARFTQSMMRAAAAHGAELRRAAVTGIARRRGGAVEAVETDQGAIATDAVVIAMGPWVAPCRRRRCSSKSRRAPARAPRPRCSRAPTARPMSARFRLRARCRRTRPTSRPTPVRSSASRRSAGRCRRCSPRARSLPARPATAR